MELLQDPDVCVDKVLAKVGKDLRIGAPLAAGKPNHLLNAFYRRAKQDPEISLIIYTALTLERPKGRSDLEKRFLGPMVERVFGNYPDLEYELDRVAGKLPDNVQVREFYFPAGKFSSHSGAQRSYISTNYTYVARDLLDRGVNVLMQQVAWDDDVGGEPMVSLSCNSDVAPDLMLALGDRDDVAFVGQTNDNLPFMYGDALVKPAAFDFLVRNEALNYTVFGPPRMSVPDADYMIGLYASTLVRDGGELQIGIGSLGDALVYNLLLRHEDNTTYLDVLDRLKIRDRDCSTIDRIGQLAPFDSGLFAATEMLVDPFMHLIKRGVLKRRVYDDLPLQRLLNEGLIEEQVEPSTLRLLLQRRAISERLEEADVSYLRRFGILRDDVRWSEGELIAGDGSRIGIDLRDEQTFSAICERCLGDRLKEGAIVHAGFFLGPQAFYSWLKDMPSEDRKRIQMRSVSRINQLYGHEAVDRLHRRNARFINTGMMVTLSGAVVSDGLEDGTVISGVGGQYNFVAMAHALPDGHSILQIRSTRTEGAEVRSNVVFNYGHTTIPRHQRDIIITEYGIADLRGQTDEDVIKALLNVADSRFQDELMAAAKAAGKLDPAYEIPDRFRHNTPELYSEVLTALKERDLYPKFPFGTDLTEEEIVVGGALKRLKARMASGGHALEAMADAAGHGGVNDDVLPYLKRMGLDEPSDLKETLYQRLLAAELRHDPKVGGQSQD